MMMMMIMTANIHIQCLLCEDIVQSIVHALLKPHNNSAQAIITFCTVEMRKVRQKSLSNLLKVAELISDRICMKEKLIWMESFTFDAAK